MNFDENVKRLNKATQPRARRLINLRRRFGDMKRLSDLRSIGMNFGNRVGGTPSRSSSSSVATFSFFCDRPGSGCRKREPLTL